jgi:hypothetical protein
MHNNILLYLLFVLRTYILISNELELSTLYDYIVSLSSIYILYTDYNIKKGIFIQNIIFVCILYLHFISIVMNLKMIYCFLILYELGLYFYQITRDNNTYLTIL